MSLLARARSWAARHPRLTRTAIGVIAVVVALDLWTRTERLDAARRQWGDTTTVWVATVDLAPGDPVLAEPRSYPLALAGASHLTRDPAGLVALQHVGSGDTMRASDVGRSGLDLLPSDWRGVPLAVEAVPALIEPGRRVDVVAAGVLVASDAVVVAVADRSVIVGVPADAAPAVADAARLDEATLVVRSD